MKFNFNKLSPKRFFPSKPRNHVSKSDSLNNSTSSSTSSSSSSSKLDTPKSVLPDTTSLAWSDTFVSRTELETLLRPEEVNMLLRDFCDDKCSNMISLEALNKRLCEYDGDNDDDDDHDELKETFEFFDTDGDGKITAEELLSVFTALGDERCNLEDCEKMIAGVDKNQDGFVCFQDFCVMMEQQQLLQRS